MNKEKLIFNSIKYVIFSWSMIVFLLYIGFIFINFYYAPAGVAIILSLIFIPFLFLISLSRFFYVKIYEEYIEVKHILLPFFKQKFFINEIKFVACEQVCFGGKSNYGMGKVQYIPCLVVYFDHLNGYKPRKIYWHVSSFYQNYHSIFHKNIRNFLSSKNDIFRF